MARGEKKANVKKNTRGTRKNDQPAQKRQVTNSSDESGSDSDDDLAGMASVVAKNIAKSCTVASSTREKKTDSRASKSASTEKHSDFIIDRRPVSSDADDNEYRKSSSKATEIRRCVSDNRDGSDSTSDSGSEDSSSDEESEECDKADSTKDGMNKTQFERFVDGSIFAIKVRSSRSTYVATGLSPQFVVISQTRSSEAGTLMVTEGEGGLAEGEEGSGRGGGGGGNLHIYGPHSNHAIW